MNSYLSLLRCGLLIATASIASADVLSLDGTGDYVTFSGTGIPSGNASFTIESWINPTSVPGAQDGGMITFWGNQSANQANGFRLRGGGGGRHFFWSNDHDVDFGRDLLPDTTGDSGWHHLAVTFNGTQTQWYFNGAPIGAPRTSVGVNVAALNHRIGNRLNAEFFHGYIDEVRIWDKARSAAEIAADYRQKLTGNETNLVAYFDFEGDFGDRAGGNNNGTAIDNASINTTIDSPVAGGGGPVIQSFTATPSAGFEGDSSTLAWTIDASAVTGTLSVEILGAGGGVLHTTSNASGNYVVVIGDLGGITQTLTYTLRASDSGGAMISREATVGVAADPGIPSAGSLSLSTVTTTPVPATLTGTDLNGHPNATLTFAIVSQPSSGALSGVSPNFTYTANGGFTGSDSFTFKANDGKYDSPAATVTINVVPPPSPPTDIILSNLSIGNTVINGGFIASILTIDPNSSDSHTYSLVTGAGGTDNGMFSIVGNQLRAATSFSGLIGNTYSIRLRTTDNGGLNYEEGFTLSVIEVSDDVVINEIHYNPPSNTVRQEFIELYNPSAAAANISGWRFSGAVAYAIPDGTSIVAGGYLVIAEDPATLSATLGAAAIGPYLGNLSGDGETIRLRDANNTVIDEVDYNVGFPWPVAADGNGPSIELINPALDNSLGSSWRASAAGTPTPGASNSSFSTNAPPNIRKVEHMPAQPVGANPVVISANVTDPEAVASVFLEYQVVTPGAYVPAFLPHPVPNIPTETDRPVNTAYETGWTAVTMLDDGIGSDVLAGDDIYSATLPAQAHRTLVRYRITVEDGLGLSVRVPYEDDPGLNFAYFVYDGIPAYEGNSASVMANTLPVYHLITRSEDYSKCIAYNVADQIPQSGQARFYYNWNGTIVYNGIVYDNIRYRLRGANGRYQSTGKRSMRFRLNDGHFLQAHDQLGKAFGKTWRTLTLGKCSSNRLTLTYGLNEALNFHLFNKVGVPAANAGWLQWRVIDDALEAPDSSHGDFHGMYLFTETYDVNFLGEHKLEKGNLYKLINQTQDWAQQQRYQAAFAPSDGSDHDTIEQQLDGNDDAAYIRAHVNLEKWNRYHALVQAIRHYDYWPSANKNMVYYFEPDYLPANNFKGKLWIIPWDTDATWGPTYNAGHDVVYNALFSSNQPGGDAGSTPELWPDYYNAVREVRDLLWQPDQIIPLVDEFASFISPLESADSSRWKGTPADAGNYNGLHGPGMNSLAAYAQDMKNFAFTGGSWDGGNVGAGGRATDLDAIQGENGEAALIPNTPTISYSGSVNYPTSGLSFQSTAFSDPQGVNTFGAMEWRIAQITNVSAPAHDPAARFKLEWDADWESGELTTFNNTIAIPTIAVRSGLTYRARVRHQDNSGRWSHWSAAAEFTATLPDLSDYLAGLVISEFSYHPADPSAAEINAGFGNDDFFEYIELKNVGSTTLNLTDVRFTKGIDFNFLGTAITSLAPGEIVLVVANIAAFEMRYGTGLPIAGVWQITDKLSNGGERLKLSFGAGDTIRDFTFGDAAPWPITPDGAGFSLTLIAPASVPNHASGSNWRASYAAHGTPGMDEPDSDFQDWLVSNNATDPLASYAGADLSNLMVYATGTDLAPSRPEISTISGFPSLSFRVRQSATEITYIVEVSENLTLWQSGSGYTVQVGAPVDNADGTETITVRSLLPIGSEPEQFLRLRVETQL